MSIKIYLSASTQEKNIGVAGYGTEEDNMFKLRDRIEYYIDLADINCDFVIFKNKDKNMTLSEIVQDSNKNKVILHLANHSNAGTQTVRGCESYYSHLNKNGNGKKISDIWYDFISAVTPTTDRGSRPDSVLYSSGLYELSNTNAVACLMEHFYHTNENDVKFYKANIDLFAIATVKAIFKYFNLKFDLPDNEKMLTWQEIIKKESDYADIWIKHMKTFPSLNWSGLIQKLYYSNK